MLVKVVVFFVKLYFSSNCVSSNWIRIYNACTHWSDMIYASICWWIMIQYNEIKLGISQRMNPRFFFKMMCWIRLSRHMQVKIRMCKRKTIAIVVEESENILLVMNKYDKQIQPLPSTAIFILIFSYIWMRYV